MAADFSLHEAVIVDAGTFAQATGTITALDTDTDGTPRVWVRTGDAGGSRTRLYPVERLRPVPASAPPIAATEVWQAVMDRAGHQCECTYKLHKGKHRGSPGGRCHQIAGTPTQAHPGDVSLPGRLIAGPARPGPRPERVIDRTPVEDLRAWCLPCWAHAVKLARQAGEGGGGSHRRSPEGERRTTTGGKPVVIHADGKVTCETCTVTFATDGDYKRHTCK
jgi:hypothetical protein